ncbi:MAG: hypothetical protein ACOYMB_01290 [Patescibacteria group bacterium]
MSDNKLMLDVSQAHELKMAFRRNGWTNQDIKTLSEGSVLRRVLAFINGNVGISYPEHIIDCDAAPSEPEGLTLVSHKKGGLFKYNSNIQLYLSSRQRKGGLSTGNEIRGELENSPVLNANVLDYLYHYPELIPESWDGLTIFFWGTIYRNEFGSLCVRYLDLVNGLGQGRKSFDCNFFSDSPAALADPS